MMGRLTKTLIAATVLALPAAPAAAVLINFDDLTDGTTLSNQYAGVTFAANGFTGAGGPYFDWATNTDMTIVSIAGGDIGTLGTPSLVSGNILRSFSGWLGEDGDASFSITFASAINAISMDFAGVYDTAEDSANVRIFAYDGATLLGSVAGPASTTGQFTLSYAASNITRVVVTPGSFYDWVGVDNINYTPATAGAVPEPATWAMMIAGFGLIGGTLRRRAVRVRYA